MKKIIFFIFLLLSSWASAQDSVSTAEPASAFIQHSFTDRQQFLDHLVTHNTVFRGSDQPSRRLMRLVKKDDLAMTHKNHLFYLLLGLCFLLAVIRYGFRKYFKDLFRAFYSPTLSQRQLKDQLRQTPFPDFALNAFFVFSGGIYLYLILLHTRYISITDPLYLAVFFIGLLILSYTLKYVILRLCSWLFGVRELIDNYIFTLYLINKILGVILLPFILILAFSPPVLSNAALNISLILVAFLFLYRYARVFPMVQPPVNLSKFHFFLYLCGLEIAPILIIGKLTLIWLNGA